MDVFEGDRMKRKKFEFVEVRLTSSHMIHAPGKLAYAVHYFQHGSRRDRVHCRAILNLWDHKMSATEVSRLLKGEIKFTTDFFRPDTVVISFVRSVRRSVKV